MRFLSITEKCNGEDMLNRNSLRYLLLGFFICVLLILSGCAPNTMYRYNYTPCTANAQDTCEHSAIASYGKGTNSEFELGFVEYDDQGQLRDRVQMQSVLDYYSGIAGKDDVIIVTFIHGWHHSAAPGDNNIESFKKALQKTSVTETISSRQDGRKRRKILGIYIGWRGDSLKLPLLKQATFWARKSVAQEVGLQGVSEVLLRLEEIVNVKSGLETEIPKPNNNRMVVIGHSFGGAVLYTSLQQILADRHIGAHKGKTYSSDAGGFADLVVLMNPAFEATRYATLFDLSQSCSRATMACRNYSVTQLPNLAVLTSEGDGATRYAFPAGRFFSTLFETHDTLERLISTKESAKVITVSESKADNTTIGHFNPFWTHTLDPINKEDIIFRTENFNFGNLVDLWAEQSYDNTLYLEKVKLKHLGRSHPHNPYLNIYVSKELIPNHNDIWGDEIQQFLHDLIIISTNPE